MLAFCEPAPSGGLSEGSCGLGITMAHAYNASNGEVESGISAQGYIGLHIEFKPSMSYMRPCVNKHQKV